MKRRGRNLLNVVTAASLVLCVITAFTWRINRGFHSFWSARAPAGRSLDTRIAWSDSVMYAPLPGAWFPRGFGATFGVSADARAATFLLFRPRRPVSISPVMGHTTHNAINLPPRPPPADAVAWSRTVMSTWRCWNRAGVALGDEPCIDWLGDYRLQWTGNLYELTLHYAYLVVLTGALPVVRCVRWLRRAWRAQARALNAQCVACGYDLRATPGRCPECGQEAGA